MNMPYIQQSELARKLCAGGKPPETVGRWEAFWIGWAAGIICACIVTAAARWTI